MAWLESHQELADHPKTKRAARRLSIGIPQMVGHLHCLWWWSMDYAQDGDLSEYSAADIAEAARWEEDPDEFVQALRTCGTGDGAGFLTSEDAINDWDQFGGKYLKRREQARDRQRKKREQDTHIEGSHANVTRDSDVSHTARGQDIREQEKTEEIAPQKPARPRKPDPTFEVIYELWLEKPYEPPGECTDDERGRINRAAKQLRKRPEAVPDEIRTRWSEAEARAGPGYPVVPETLTKSWTDLANGRAQHQQENGKRPRGTGTIDAAGRLFERYAEHDSAGDGAIPIDRGPRGT